MAKRTVKQVKMNKIKFQMQLKEYTRKVKQEQCTMKRIQEAM